MEFQYCRLRDVLSSIYSGGTPSTSVKEYWDGSYKWLSSGETGQRFISDTLNTITERGIKESSTKLAKRGSIVMACAGQGKTRGQTSFLLDDMYVNQSVIVLNPDTNKVFPLYLFYDLSRRYEELRGGSDASSTRGSITTTSLKTISFQYPSIEKQKKIANILYLYDQLIETNSKRIKVLEQMAENLYKEWFVRFRFPGHETAEFENGIPKGWKPGYLREIMSFSSGKPKPNDGTAFPVYGGNGITDWCNSYSHENVIILGRVGAYCGSTYFETGKCWISDNALYRISKRNDFKSFFYDYMLLKTLNLNKFQGGTGQPLITQGLLSRIKCILPSNDMVYSYDSVVRPIFDLIRTIHSKNNNLVKQRDLLLPRLMSGKMEV